MGNVSAQLAQYAGAGALHCATDDRHAPGHTSRLCREATRTADNWPSDWRNGAIETTPIGGQERSGSAARRCVVFPNSSATEHPHNQGGPTGSQHLHALFLCRQFDSPLNFRIWIQASRHLIYRITHAWLLPAAFQICVLPPPLSVVSKAECCPSEDSIMNASLFLPPSP